MKIVKVALAVILIALLAIGIYGCGENGGVSFEEASEIVKGLMVSANEINRIHYGEGISHVEDESDNLYADAHPSERYKSLEDIEVFTYKIYTQDLARAVLDRSFGESEEIVDTTPRYIAVKYENQVKLLVKKDIEPFAEIYEYDLNEIEILGTSDGVIEAKIKTTTGKYKSFVFKYEENGWRIDTPTY
ncbi:MAG: hypothetical protein IJ309_01675 [Clostridia bacterium]|nr:hypothetical protein [Clostridia bacterium]